MEKHCPNCGAPIHEKASFCPSCTQSVNPRQEASMPHPLPKWMRSAAGVLVLLLAVVAAVGYVSRPKTCDGVGELFYTDQDGSYHLTVSKAWDPMQPLGDLEMEEEEGKEFRMPSEIYIFHQEDYSNVAPDFMKKVKSVTAEFLQEKDAEFPMECGEPEHMQDYRPNAAWVTLVDFIGSNMEAQLLYTITMKNGDVLHLRQNYHLKAIPVIEYHPEDTPMETTAELKALLDRISEEDGPSKKIVRIYLPPVTYTEELRIKLKDVSNLMGTDGPDGSRTTFTKTLMVEETKGSLPQIEHIDFQGDGTGIGISSCSNLHIYDCRFTNWKKGVLAYGYAWINVRSSLFEGNQIGFHFNSEGESVTHSQYNDNRFVDNGTAILLERVSTEHSISFQDTRFEGNGTDIDNRCDQPLDVSGAIFQ